MAGRWTAADMPGQTGVLIIVVVSAFAAPPEAASPSGIEYLGTLGGIVSMRDGS